MRKRKGSRIGKEKEEWGGGFVTEQEEEEASLWLSGQEREQLLFGRLVQRAREIQGARDRGTGTGAGIWDLAQQ